MPQAPQWEDSEAAPSWDDSEETPSWDQSTTIEAPEPPRRFLSPDEPIPDVGGGLPPRMTEADLAQAEKQSKLGEEIAGTMAEAQIVGNAERAITLAEEGIVSPKVAEMAMAVGAPALNTLPGVRRALAEAGSGLTSPVNLGMMLGAGGASAIPKIGGAVARGIAGGFATDIATHMPELGAAAGEASATGTPEEQQKAFTDIGVSALMGGLAAGGAVHRARPVIPPRIVEAIAKGDAAGLTKATQTLADVVREQPKQEVQSAEAIRTDPGQVREAGRQPEVVQDQSRQDLQQPAPEPSQPVGTQAGQSTEVLLTGPEVIKSIVELPDAEAGALRQKPAVEAGMKLTEADVPALEAARAKTMKEATEAAEAGNNDAFKAAFGKNIWFSGAIEGARRKGPNYDTFIKEQKAAEKTPVEVGLKQEAGGGLPETKTPSEVAAEQVGGTIPKSVSGELQNRTSVPANIPETAQAFFERESEVGRPAEVGHGMGGAKASEPVDPRAQLAQLTDSIATLAAEGKSAPAKAFDLGRALSQAKETVTSTLDGLKAAGQYMKKRLEGKPVATEYRGVLGDRHLALSESSVNARRWMKDVKKAVPDPMVREAISDWVDTGGDPALLAKAASETKPQYKAGYERAQKLTPEEKVVAENLKNYFDSRLQEAIDAGVLEDGIENYIHRAYEAESPWKKGVIQELRSGLFTGNPALAKKRVFEYDFEAEKLGKKPVKDFAQRVAAYDLALNKSIADRAAVKAMMEIKMSDGRPMIDVGGGGKIIENAAGEAQATLINRSAKKIDPNDPKADRGDFKPFDHPALRKWKWATEDTAGKPIFVKGDVLIHPEAIKDIRKLLEPSAIRRNPVGRAALGVSSTIKQTMLDLSGFHPVQIAVHGTEHRTFAPVKEIDFTNPDVRGLIRGGAAVGETSGHAAFSEGVSGAGSSLTKHIPWAGERLQAYNSWLFEDYIPRLKVAMGLHALERNRGRYKDLSSDQLYQLTADQMNAAFGEQNYTMLGRSKTTQDALRLALLAPDFLEARGRFAAQAFTKYGAEQRQALILGAVTMYITARMLNKMMTDEYHFEPKNAFNLVVDGKSYGLRTVQGDLIHAVTEPGKFINHRLNPVYGKPALEFVTGRDYFGRKREGVDKLKDFALTPVPIGLRGAFENQEQTLLDTFLNSFGLVTKRDSPSSDIAELAKEWKKDNDIKTGPGEFIYDAEQDPYRPIKLAAERDDEAGARSEIAKAINEGMKRSQIINHFKLSEKHRFAGSAANERKFLESLTEDQKKIYQDAKQERRRIRELVMRALP